MSLPLFALTVALTALLTPAPQRLGEARKPTAPESFTTNAHITGKAGAVAATMTIKIDRYTPDAARDAVTEALKQSGYPAFLEALRKAPVVGSLTLSGETFSIRWARQESFTNGRSIVLITDKPVYFVGGGSVNAKPREGYDVALLQFKMADSGIGYSGTMAAAARVKAGGETGVQIDDYAEKPIELQNITRAIK
jgi:hypothetical protein